MYWNTITSIDRGLRYVSHLGFTVSPGFPGWIPAAQERMVHVETKLWKAAGKTFPYQVHYHRKKQYFAVRSDRVIVKVDAKGL